MILCEHCREALASHGEEFSLHPLTEAQLTQVHEDEDGLEWLVCEWCEDEDTVEGMKEVSFI